MYGSFTSVPLGKPRTSTYPDLGAYGLVTNPGLFGTGDPMHGHVAPRPSVAGGTSTAGNVTTSGTGMGVREGAVGAGEGIGGAGGAPGDASGGGACPFAFWLFPGRLLRRGVLRGSAGVLFGCAIELPSLLKKSPMELPATASGPLARNKLIAKIETNLPDSRPIGPAIVHYAAQCCRHHISSRCGRNCAA